MVLRLLHTSRWPPFLHLHRRSRRRRYCHRRHRHRSCHLILSCHLSHHLRRRRRRLLTMRAVLRLL